MGRIFLATPNTSALMSRPDVYALLFRIIETEAVERVHLSGLLEFWRLGGRLEDLRPNDVGPFLHVMEKDRRKFAFMPGGINMLRQEHLVQLKEAFGPGGKKINPFAKRALE